MHLGGPSNKIDASIQHAGKLRLRGYTGSLVTKTIRSRTRTSSMHTPLVLASSMCMHNFIFCAQYSNSLLCILVTLSYILAS